MKKPLSCLILALFSFSAVALSLKDFSLSVEPLFGMRWGQIDEYVYQKDSGGDYKKLSELNWQIKNMFEVGGNIEGGFRKIKGKIHFSALIPGDSGVMEDSDWVDLNSVKTTFSKSENSLVRAYDFSVLLKYEFQPVEFIKIAPLFEFEYKLISFEARNGYGWYGNEVTPHVSWDDDKAVYYKSGKLCGIDYRREIKQFFIGYYFEYRPIKRLKLFDSFAIAPYAYTVSYDTHYSDRESTRGTDYADEVAFFFTRLKYTTGCYYAFTERLELGLQVSFFYAFQILGTTYKKSHSSSTYSKMTDKGGAGAWDFAAAITCRFNIF